MKKILINLPRTVLISLVAIVASVVIFGVLVPTLGGALDDSLILNSRLKGEIDQTRKTLTQSDADTKYVNDHQEEYEALLKGDKLIPHTRRAAVVELQNRARQQGITGLNYNFQAAGATSLSTAQSQPASGAYMVSVEGIDLKIGAPIDGAIYRFIDDINESFPGAVVVDSFTLSRALEVTEDRLSLVSSGKASGLVDGGLKLIWRTAQATDKGKDK